MENTSIPSKEEIMRRLDRQLKLREALIKKYVPPFSRALAEGTLPEEYKGLLTLFFDLQSQQPDELSNETPYKSSEELYAELLEDLEDLENLEDLEELYSRPEHLGNCLQR